MGEELLVQWLTGHILKTLPQNPHPMDLLRGSLTQPFHTQAAVIVHIARPSAALSFQASQ